LKSTLIANVGIGIVIGLGITLVILGFFGVLHTSLHAAELSRFFEKFGTLDITELFPFYWMIADLNELRWHYIIFIAIGLVSLLLGGILLAWEAHKTKEQETNE